MPEVVLVSNLEKTETLKLYLEDLFKQGRYAEMTQAIGMHSILIDPQHMLKDQAVLYRAVLNMIKDRIGKAKGKSYAAWYEDFPRELDQLESANQIVVDKSAADILASHESAFGSFKSVDDFFFWALDDRRLTLEQILKYIDRTAGIGFC